MKLANRAALLLALTGAVASIALAAPPSDDDLKARNGAFRSAYMEAQGDKDKIAAAAKTAVEGVSIAELSLEQLQTFAFPIYWAERADEARARLATFAVKPDADGAKAAILSLQFLDAENTPAQQQADAVKAALAHPGLPDALRSGEGFDLFSQMRGASAEAQKLIAPEIAKVAALIPSDIPAPMLARLPGVAMAVARLEGVDPAAVEAVRARSVDLVKAGVAKADSDRMRKGLETALTRLEGAAAKGKLIDHAAPAMTIAWSSDPSIKSIDDLKGKVVVLDFWATWCGPCIASFPNVRDLQSHYEGYPVVIVGVTSLQGAHFGSGGKIDTKDDPAKEHSLMSEFMKEKEMTWPVVFTEQEVFNPDYGVMGIPHVAILAPDGTVRHNGLHPASPLAEKTAKINALLKEFQLGAPTE